MTSTGLGPLWLFGCGNMGGAMLRRWVASGIDPASVTVFDRIVPTLPDRVSYRRSVDENTAPNPAVVVLAVKPQQLDEAAASLRPVLSGAPVLLVSILAGVEQATLRDRFGCEAVVRAMPNLPVAIGEGVTALHTSSVDPGVRAAAGALATPLGAVEWIADEWLFDAVTALSGCGPGFVFRFIDALAAAGAELGLPADQALRLAWATVAGSARMASDADESPATLADRVASPGGSTREGLDVLDRDDALRRLLAETLAAAARRNAELASAARAG